MIKEHFKTVIAWSLFIWLITTLLVGCNDGHEKNFKYNDGHEKNFKYNECVQIETGFFKGCLGRVVDRDWPDFQVYIKDCPNDPFVHRIVWFNNGSLLGVPDAPKCD